MGSYVAKRVATIVALAFGISVLVFLIIRLIPGDPAVALLGTNAGDETLVARLHHQLGLDQPIFVQYAHWIGGVLHGDFGYSYGQQRSVLSLIKDNLPATIELAAAGLAISLVFGTALGVAAALKRNSAFDTVAMGASLTLMSIPSFWLGLVLLIIFAVQLPWFPVFGGESLRGLVLPAVTLGLGGIGFNARFVRSSVIGAGRMKHVITAHSKGLSSRRVLMKHVVRNALLPVVTIVGLQVGQLISGVVIIETVFSRPGIGRLLVQAILAKDYLTVQAVVLIIAVFFALVNLAVDLLYPVLDPRVAATL
jgi:ABC-type dipeptide/oligopeptide/nickel transport system permease component